LNKTQLKGYFQELAINTNYQHLEESRITRRFQSNNKDTRLEKVDIFGSPLEVVNELA
jgi:hypothetical protein